MVSNQNHQALSVLEKRVLSSAVLALSWYLGRLRFQYSLQLLVFAFQGGALSACFTHPLVLEVDSVLHMPSLVVLLSPMGRSLRLPYLKYFPFHLQLSS